MPSCMLALLLLAVVSRISGLSTSGRPWDDRKRMPVAGTPQNSPVLPRVVIIGGTGRIGTAVASHLLSRAEPVAVQLAGRDRTRGEAAVSEVRYERQGFFSRSRVEFLQVDWRDSDALAAALDGAAAVVHTAGPYAGEMPEVLQAAISASVPVYVDLSDPVPYLRAARNLDADALRSGTLALCAAGAFPGLSNVLAMECAHRLDSTTVQDLDFSYFTAGLGGSGDINLYITNDGFGEEVPVFRSGELSPQLDAGQGLRKVKFFLEGGSDADPLLDASPDGQVLGTLKGGSIVKTYTSTSRTLVGERSVWNWPFPEGCALESLAY